MFYNSLCLFVVCTSNGVHFYLSLSCWEKLILSCVSMKLLKTSIMRFLFCLCMFLSLSVSELHCDIGYMAVYIDLLCFTSRLDNPPAIITCFNRTLSTHVFLSWVCAQFDFFVCLGFWWVCHAFLCFFVFSKWWKVHEWQIEVLYTYKKNNMNNASIYSLQELRTISEV